MKRATTLILISVALIVVLLLVWQSWVPPSRARREIIIAQFGDFFLYAPIYVAIDAGFFERYGLDVSLISTGGDEKTWAAVISGDASFGVADPTFVAIAAVRGQPGKVVASIVNGVPFWGIALDPNLASIQDPAELSGHTVATFPSPSTAFSLQTKMFQDAGLAPRIREGAFGTLIPMMRAGEADIALELEPNVSQGLKQGAHIVYSMKEVYGDFAITALTTTPRLINEDAELVQDVVCALQLALDFLRQQPTESLVLLSQRFPEIDDVVAQNALARVLSEDILPQDATIGYDAWDKAIELRVAVGDLPSHGLMESYVENSFAEKAVHSCRLTN